MLHGSLRPLGLDAQSSYVTLLSSAASHHLLSYTSEHFAIPPSVSLRSSSNLVPLSRAASRMATGKSKAGYGVGVEAAGENNFPVSLCSLRNSLGVWGSFQVALFWLVPEMCDWRNTATRGINSGFSWP